MGVKNIVTLNRVKALGGYGVSHFISILQPIIIVPIITRSLSLNDYGIYALFIVLFGFFQPLSSFNTSSFLMKEYHGEIEGRQQEYNGNFILIIAGLTGFLLLLVFLLKKPILSLLEIDSTFILICAIINTFFVSVFNLVKSQLRSEDNLVWFVVINAISVLLIVGLIIIFYSCKSLSLFWAIISHLVGFGVISIIGYFKVLNLSFNFWKHANKKIVFRTFMFCWPLVLHSLSAKFFTMSDRFIINKFMDKDCLGVYSAAFQLAFGVSAAGSIIQMAWSPFIFKKMAKSKVINNGIKKKIYTLIIGIFIFSGVYILAYPFVYKLYYPVEYISGLDYFHWFIIGGTFQCIYWILNPFLMVFEKNIYYFVITLITSIFSLSFNFYMIRYGIEYLALSFFLSWLLQVLSIMIAIFLISRKNRLKNV